MVYLQQNLIQMVAAQTRVSLGALEGFQVAHNLRGVEKQAYPAVPGQRHNQVPRWCCNAASRRLHKVLLCRAKLRNTRNGHFVGSSCQ